MENYPTVTKVKILSRFEKMNKLRVLLKLRQLKDYYIIKRSGLFDSKYYLKKYKDVLFADTDPLKHYVKFGVFEGRNPNNYFSTYNYLRVYLDVKKAEVNPLRHFITFGKKEGRLPSPRVNINTQHNYHIKSTPEYGTYLMNQSVDRRLKNIDEYLQKIKNYQHKIKTQREKNKIVIYSAIANNYDSLKLPEFLDDQIDYVIFSNDSLSYNGIWQVRPLPINFQDPTRICRYIKTNPHKLFKNYEVAIWLDSSFMIIDTLSPDIKSFLDSGKEIAAIPHPFRNNIYDEAEACIRNSRDSAKLIKKQINYYRKFGFSHNDLIESNFIMFNLKMPKTLNFLDTWWSQIEKFSRRDQLSINYSLRHHQIIWHSITDFPHSARDHPALAFIDHDQNKSSAVNLLKKVKEFYELSKIDVIVPVYNAMDDVKNCLKSLELYKDGFEINVIVVNDGSNHQTSDWLRKFCQIKQNFVLIDYSQNQGYTKSINCGLREAKSNYVIALNSDTIVTQGWLKGLYDCINSNPKIGIVGPLSNAASWQSVPELMNKEEFKVNELPKEITPNNLAEIVRKVSKNYYPRINVINGFCFMMKREVIRSIGYMDEINFPVGYGEENDYCIRAARAGYELAVADNSYVYHAKSKSFGHDRRKALSKQGAESLVRLHGIQSVKNLTNNLRHHPVLDKIRKDILSELSIFKTNIKKSYKSVILIPELTDSGSLAGTAYVRLIEPYINSNIFDSHYFKIHTSSLLPKPGTARCVILQRRLSQFEYFELKDWLLRWRQSGGTIIYDLDDDLFDFEGLSTRSHINRDLFTKIVEKINLVLHHSDCVTVSTQALKNKINNKNLNVRLLPNFLNQRSWQGLTFSRPKVANQPIILGYIGTPSHHQDLKLIIKVIKNLEKYYGNKIKVETIGVFENQTPLFGKKIKVGSNSPYPKFVDWLHKIVNWDIGLIPLVKDSFNNCKSHIKFLEYAALDMAIICSEGETYKTIAKNYQNCLVVENIEEKWIDAAKILIENTELRKRLSIQAREDVIQKFTIQSNIMTYRNLITDILN